MVYWGKERNDHFAKIVDCFPLPMAKAIGAGTEISLLHRNLLCVCLWDKWGWQQARREGGWHCRRARCQSIFLWRKAEILKCALSLPEERGSAAGGLQSRAFVCYRPGGIDHGSLGKLAGPGSLELCHLPALRACQRFISSPAAREDLFPLFLLPPDFVAKGGAQELETLWCFITGTLLEKCSPLGSDLVKVPISAEIWCSYLGSS